MAKQQRGFDPGMPWHIANWRERIGIAFFQFVMWGVLFPAMLAGGLCIVAVSMEGIGRHNAEHDRCLEQASNGYEIRACR